MPITTAQSPFRTDPLTGLRIDLTAQALVKTNAVLAVVFLLIGGLAGVLVGLTRWPTVNLLPPDLFTWGCSWPASRTSMVSKPPTAKAKIIGTIDKIIDIHKGGVCGRPVLTLQILAV